LSVFNDQFFPIWGAKDNKKFYYDVIKWLPLQKGSIWNLFFCTSMCNMIKSQDFKEKGVLVQKLKNVTIGE